jgi:hypothetical protein
MNGIIKWLKFSIIVTFIAVMLASSLQEVFASSTDNIDLPDFLVRYAQYQSKGNATEFNRIINQMIKQEQIKRDTIASTNGAILQPPLSSSQVSSGTASALTGTTGWMSYLIGYSPPTYDIVTGYMVGCIKYASRLAGQNDGNYALLWTNGWNEDYNNPQGGEAFGFGAVWNGQSGWMNGFVYVYGYTGVPSWQNYVMINYYDGSNWNYLGYGTMSNTSPNWVYIGYTSTQFTQISVVCWTPPPYPVYYEPLIKNYVWIDSVKIVS